MEQLHLRLKKLEQPQANKTRALNDDQQCFRNFKHANYDVKHSFKSFKLDLTEKVERIGQLMKQTHLLSAFNDVNMECFLDEICFSSDDVDFNDSPKDESKDESFGNSSNHFNADSNGDSSRHSNDGSNRNSNDASSRNSNDTSNSNSENGVQPSQSGDNF